MSKKTRGTGRIYLRGSTYWIQYGYRGRDVRESSHSDVQSVARKLLAKRLGEVGSGRLVGPDAERVSFADLERGLLTDYEVRGRRSLLRDAAGNLKGRLASALDHLRRAFGEHRALDVSTDAIREYEVQRLATAKRATVNYELALLRRMFKLAVEAGMLTAAHVPVIHTPDPKNARQGFFSEGDYKKLLLLLPEEVRPVITMAFCTGWRMADEIIPLRWEQVDFTAGTVTLPPNTTKSGAARVFPFTLLPELDTMLREQRARTSALVSVTGQDIPFVFHRQGQPILSIRRQWEKACKAAGLADHGAHNFRRTAARRLIRAGVAQHIVMRLCGWETDSMFRRYAIVDERDLQDAVGKLASANRTITGQKVPDPA